MFAYKIVRGSYGYEDQDIFPEKIYQGAPRLEDYTGGPVSAQHDWSGGGGQLKFEDEARFWAGDADTRFQGRVGLGPCATQMGRFTTTAVQATFPITAISDDGYLMKEVITPTLSYSACRVSAAFVSTSLSYLAVGQTFLPFNYVRIRRPYMRFLTESIPDSDVVTSATLRLYLKIDSSVTDFDIQVRRASWGPTLASGDWSATPSGDTLIGTLNTANLPAINNWTEFSLTPSEIPKAAGQYLETYLISSRDDDDPGTAPTGSEDVWFESLDAGGGHAPELVVNYGTTGGGVTFDAPISHFKEFKSNLYAFGAQYGYVLDKASPTLAWSRLAPPLTGSLTGTITDVEVYDNYVWLAVGSSARYYYSASLLHATIACTQAMSPIDAYADHFEVLEGTLWKAASYVPNSRIYSDVRSSTTPLLNWSNPNPVGDTDQPINNLRVWNGLLWTFKPDGIYTFDSKGIAYDLMPEMKQYRDPNLGKPAVVHQNELYFRAGNGLKRFDGSTVRDVHPQVYFQPAKTRMPVDAWSGTIRDMLASDSWLWLSGIVSPIYTNVLLAYDNRQEAPKGWHGLGLAATSGALSDGPPTALYYSTVAPSGMSQPWLYMGLASANLVQRIKLPEGSNDPGADSTSKYAFQGTTYFSEMDLGLEDQEKAILYVRIHTLNLGAGGYIDLSYFLNDSTSAISLATIDSSTIDAAGWQTITSTVTGKRVVWRVRLYRNNDGTTPYYDSFAVYWHVRPRRMRNWTAKLLLAANAVPGDSRGTEQMESHLTTLRDNAGSIAFVDRFGASYNVFLTKFSRQEILKEGAREPETVAEISLLQYATP